MGTSPRGAVLAVFSAGTLIVARFDAQHLGRACIELDLGQLPRRCEQLDLVNPAIPLLLQLHFEHLAGHFALQALQHCRQRQHLARLHGLAGKGGDDVVGLPAGQVDCGDADGVECEFRCG